MNTNELSRQMQVPGQQGKKEQQVQQTQNPFVPLENDSLAHGSIAIERSRATADTQAAVLIAKTYPRDEASAWDKLMRSCSSLALAEKAFFSYPRGGSQIKGITIDLMLEIARCWGNIKYGTTELSRSNGKSEFLVWAWDLESNLEIKVKFEVPHRIELKGGVKELTSDRDIYELGANMAARRLRSALERILPPVLVEEATHKCLLTLNSKGADDKSIESRVKSMLSRFSEIGINAKTISDYTGGAIDKITTDQVNELSSIYQAIKNGATWGELTAPKDK